MKINVIIDAPTKKTSKSACTCVETAVLELVVGDGGIVGSVLNEFFIELIDWTFSSIYVLFCSDTICRALKYEDKNSPLN